MSEELNTLNIKRCASLNHPLYWSTEGVRLWEAEVCLAFFSPSPQTVALNMDVKEILLTCVRKFVIHSQEESSHL